MEAINKDMTINETIAKFPKTISVFNRFNIDACCGGDDTILEGAGHSSVSLENLLKALNDERQ